MYINEGIVYDVGSKAFVGNVTLPEHEGVANHGLVFMLGSISSRWKQTVAYYFTSDSVKGHTLKAIVDDIISRAESLSIHIHSVTSDMGAYNKSMLASYKIHCSSSGSMRNLVPHPFEPELKLYFMADVPHLLKNIKQSLFNNKFITIPEDD